LSELIEITDQEIIRRKELLRLSDEESVLLVNCGVLIDDDIAAVIDEFYRVQSADQEIFRLIGEPDTLRRLHATQGRYVRDLFSGRTDAEYVRNRLHIGLVHKNIGVDPKLYLSAVKLLKDLLFKTMERRISDPALLFKTCQALDKLLYFDITLIFDAYTRSMLNELETEKDRVAEYAASLEIQVAERTRELQEKVAQLEAALGTVKKLEGVIPICGVCKKIRDDKESWHQLEQYISEHSEALFSHGLCPDCYEKEMLGLKAMKEARLAKENLS
jgi:diguanylate cyclase